MPENSYDFLIDIARQICEKLGKDYKMTNLMDRAFIEKIRAVYGERTAAVVYIKMSACENYKKGNNICINFSVSDSNYKDAISHVLKKKCLDFNPCPYDFNAFLIQLGFEHMFSPEQRKKYAEMGREYSGGKFNK